MSNTIENNRPKRPGRQSRVLRPMRSESLLRTMDEDGPSLGGQHRAPSGDTTRPTDAQLEWFNREVQAAINSVDWCSPF